MFLRFPGSQWPVVGNQWPVFLPREFESRNDPQDCLLELVARYRVAAVGPTGN